MTIPWRGTTPEIASEDDTRYETPGGAQNKVDTAYDILLNLLKIAVTGLSDGSEAAIARISTPYGITYDWLVDRLNASDQRLINITPETAQKTVYVSVDTGNDTTGSGISGSPYKTITKAISSINNSLLSMIKIRILPGDYRSEGQIHVRYFFGGELTITAFDGVNDVTTVSDQYLIDTIDITGCWTTIQGLKAIPSTADYAYGFFVAGGFSSIIGCSMDKAGNINSGFGCTLHSYVWIKSCKIQNSLNVISANYGAEVFTSDWNVGSTNNQNVYKLDNGATVYQGDTTIPSYTANKYLIGPSGQVIDQFGISNSVTTSNHNFITIDLSSTDPVVIPLNFQRAPSWIKASAGLSSTKVTSEGNYSNTNPSNKQSCISTDVNGNVIPAFVLINIDLGASNVNYSVLSVTNSQITLQRTAFNSPTGTIYVSILSGI